MRSRWNSLTPPSQPIVASGMADAAFGVEAAARQFGLDFVRLLTEDYFFVCRRAFLETEPMQRVLDVMKGRAFHDAVAQLPGYVAASPGAVSTVREFLDIVDAGTAEKAQEGKAVLTKPAGRKRPGEAGNLVALRDHGLKHRPCRRDNALGNGAAPLLRAKVKRPQRDIRRRRVAATNHHRESHPWAGGTAREVQRPKPRAAAAARR